MSSTSKRLKENSDEILKYINQLSAQRDEILFLVEKQKEEKAVLETEMARVTYKLNLINKSLRTRTRALEMYDATLTQIVTRYEGLADSTQGLLDQVQQDTTTLENSIDKGTGTDAVCPDCPRCEPLPCELNGNANKLPVLPLRPMPRDPPTKQTSEINKEDQKIALGSHCNGQKKQDDVQDIYKMSFSVMSPPSAKPPSANSSKSQSESSRTTALYDRTMEYPMVLMPMLNEQEEVSMLIRTTSMSKGLLLKRLNSKINNNINNFIRDSSSVSATASEESKTKTTDSSTQAENFDERYSESTQGSTSGNSPIGQDEEKEEYFLRSEDLPEEDLSEEPIKQRISKSPESKSLLSGLTDNSQMTYIEEENYGRNSQLTDHSKESVNSDTDKIIVETTGEPLINEPELIENAKSAKTEENRTSSYDLSTEEAASEKHSSGPSQIHEEYVKRITNTKNLTHSVEVFGEAYKNLHKNKDKTLSSGKRQKNSKYDKKGNATYKGFENLFQ